MKTSYLLFILFTATTYLLNAQPNQFTYRTDIVRSAYFNAWVVNNLTQAKSAKYLLLPKMVTKSQLLKSLSDERANVYHEPIKHFSSDDIVILTLEHIDTVAYSALTKTAKNVFLVENFSRTNSMDVDNNVVWVTLVWKDSKWYYDCGSFDRNPIGLVPGDIVFQPTKRTRL